jgi:hypothetical protein
MADVDPTDELAGLKQWLPTVPRDRLEQMILDAYWKNALFRDSEIIRFYRLHEHGVEMVHGRTRGRKMRW